MVERGGRLSLRRQSELLGLSRSSLYYTPREASAEDRALMRRLDELYLAHPFHGSRQMVRHLRREGTAVGRGRVRRLMRVMGLEALYCKPRTGVSHLHHRVYPYLLRRVKVERPDHLWCAGAQSQSAVAMDVRPDRSSLASNGSAFSRKSAMYPSASGAACGSFTLSGSWWTPRTRNS